MLSGNGRHRRPRQAPALLVAAGVTGSAIAIPLLGASGASAAGGTVWDQVAECESGGAWSADTGNGLYGGLQLSQGDWEKYGGLDYASSPDLASRSQQIAVGEKILADTGIQTWPACGPAAGLADSKESPGVDTGVPLASSSAKESEPESEPEPESESARTADTSSAESGSGDDAGRSAPEGSEGSGGSQDAEGSRTGDTAPSADASPTERSGADRVKSDDPDNSGQNSGTSTDATGTGGSGRHRGADADEVLLEGRDGEGSARHASRGSDAAREAIDGSYTVRPGDNLSSIADSLGVDGGWTSLYGANKDTVGVDPDYILPGQSLRIGNGDTSDGQ